MSKERPPYESHDILVAQIAELKASFSQQRLDNLVDEINSLQHQIKTLRVRNEKDVEEIERLTIHLIAPVDNGIDSLDKICKRFNDGEINLSQLVCTVWNVSGEQGHE